MRLTDRINILPIMQNEQKNAHIDRRIMEVFGEEQCKQWKNENPEFLRYQCFELEFGFALTDKPTVLAEGNLIEKLESFDPVNFPEDELELLSIGAFNPMRYNVRRSYLSRKYYEIGNTGKILMLYSGEELRDIFNQHKVA